MRQGAGVSAAPVPNTYQLHIVITWIEVGGMSEGRRDKGKMLNTDLAQREQVANNRDDSDLGESD